MDLMSLIPGFPVNKDGTSSTTAPQARLALASLIASEGGNAVRAGVFWDPELPTALVSGTAGWEYAIAKANFAASAGESDGIRLFVNDGSDTVATSTAPGSDSRYDLIYVYAPSNGEGSDTDSQPVFGVAEGTASATPTKPTGDVPSGAIVLAEALVTSADADTSEATITQVWPYTTVRGVPLPVRDSTERDAAATDMAVSGVPFEVHQLDATAGERWKVTEDGGTSWSDVLGGAGLGPVEAADYTAESHAAGKIVYDTTLDQVFVSDGSAWSKLVAVDPDESVGMLTRKPASVAGSGVSASGAEVTFTAASTVSLNDCFSSDFDYYRIVIDITAQSADSDVAMKLRAAGSDSSTDYSWQRTTAAGASVTPSSDTSASSWMLGERGSNFDYQLATVVLYGAALSQATVGKLEAMSGDSIRNTSGAFLHTPTSAYDGFTIAPGSGTITGKVRVYGYHNG